MRRLYCRGFLLSKESVRVPDHFTERPFAGMHFYHDSTVPVQVVANEVVQILFAGRALDVMTGGAADIAGQLAPALARSELAFFDALDRLSGRFVVAYERKASSSDRAGTARDLCVLHDACGLRTVFYAKKRMIVGSHAHLVASVTGSSKSAIAQFQEQQGCAFKFGWPGATTPYEDVMVLTPNTLLELPSGRVRRYFPREELRPSSVKQAADLVLPALRRQMDGIFEERRIPLMSLTAGIDSRLSLAAARPYFRSVEFFTYYSQPSSVDLTVAAHIAEVFGLTHHQLRNHVAEDAKAELSEVLAVLEKNTYYQHIHNLAYVYSRAFGDARYLHLRSNLSEIGRVFYKKWRDMPIDPKAMAAIYMRGATVAPEVERAFEEFMLETSFESWPGYDPYDLFYWEHRMGCWHSMVLLESDVAFDTHILFNSRVILKAMLAVPHEERVRAALFQHLIERELPELEGLPINPKVWPPVGRQEQRGARESKHHVMSGSKKRFWALLQPIRRALAMSPWRSRAQVMRRAARIALGLLKRGRHVER